MKVERLALLDELRAVLGHHWETDGDEPTPQLEALVAALSDVEKGNSPPPWARTLFMKTKDGRPNPTDQRQEVIGLLVAYATIRRDEEKLSWPKAAELTAELAVAGRVKRKELAKSINGNWRRQTEWFTVKGTVIAMQQQIEGGRSPAVVLQWLESRIRNADITRVLKAPKKGGV